MWTEFAQLFLLELDWQPSRAPSIAQAGSERFEGQLQLGQVARLQISAPRADVVRAAVLDGLGGATLALVLAQLGKDHLAVSCSAS
jgi:hypothetical protein